jgi:cytoskeleton protein RodZ
MTSIGECLRRERLRRNLQLEQISDELKISTRMLAAIEAEDFEKLPGGVFAKSFVRQYAHVLGLDEDEMAAEVDRMLHPEEPPESAKPDAQAVPLPRMEGWQSVGDTRMRIAGWSSSLPALLLVIVVMLVCSGIYAFWQHPRRVVATNQTARASQAARPPSNTESTVAPSAPAPPAAQESQPPRPSEAPQAAGVTPAVLKPAAASTGAPETPASPPGPVHVEITATEAAWVRAVSDGKYLFSVTIEPNQTRTVDAAQSVVLRVGNAGNVNIVLNGKPIGAIGPKGQVRNVQLTSGGFQIVAAPMSAAPLDPL